MQIIGLVLAIMVFVHILPVVNIVRVLKEK